RIYITDSTNGRILAFDNDFKYISKFTGGGILTFPTSLIRDGKGKFFVAEPTKGHVVVIDIARKSIEPIDFSAVPKANPVNPGNMAIDSADCLYVVDRANQRIIVFDSNLEFEKQILVKGSRGLMDVKVDALGRIYALNSIDGLICVYDRQGNLILKFGGRGADKGEFDFPVSLSINKKGMIFVVDQHKNQVIVFNNKGGFLFTVSMLGWREGRLHLPSFIHISKAGRIFIVDQGNARISIFE
ncbi:MAG: NHL repeat-containing protein, partial [Spirochaetales bacterium]|nr:NHL repeat-containing protein [Spirochaetales bacterium]